MDSIPKQSNEKYMPFLQYISSFEDRARKIRKIEPQDLLFIVIFS